METAKNTAELIELMLKQINQFRWNGDIWENVFPRKGSSLTSYVTYVSEDGTGDIYFTHACLMYHNKTTEQLYVYDYHNDYHFTEENRTLIISKLLKQIDAEIDGMWTSYEYAPRKNPSFTVQYDSREWRRFHSMEQFAPIYVNLDRMLVFKSSTVLYKVNKRLEQIKVFWTLEREHLRRQSKEETIRDLLSFIDDDSDVSPYVINNITLLRTEYGWPELEVIANHLNIKDYRWTLP